MGVKPVPPQGVHPTTAGSVRCREAVPARLCVGCVRDGSGGPAQDGHSGQPDPAFAKASAG